MDVLKPREQKILNFMRNEVAAKGYPPTVREVCAALKIKSTSTVFKDIQRLEQKGYIDKNPLKPRAISFLSGNKPGAANIDVGAREDIVDVPVIGNIAAGTPITAEGNIESFFPVPASYAKGETFMLTVRGNSMTGAGILDGDKILVKQQQTAENGEIVVAMLDGFLESEATVKTYYMENGQIRLQPENEEYQPIVVQDANILGIVKGVFRYLN
ncbi:MAG: transcriptional repressor LexA [Clostridiales Family XIII bacterium]|jgi:repressor LexA|nr:transcriptional repressor LexA [Clostridiales Family XIII bacterium]